MSRLAATVVLSLASLLTASSAHAFCGFYVAPTDAPLVNDATMVAMMREGTRTVLSMSNSYKGPLADFAMVVPVPIVLKKEDVKTLPLGLFAKMEQLTAPRLVEYWEQDPCAPLANDSFGYGGLGMTGTGPGGGGYGTGLGIGSVKVEAKFDVDEYEIVILSATESDGLEAWLHANKYKIPNGASAALAPYVKEQQKFFVAKVNAAKVKKDAAGVVTLSPLRVSYESSDFRLPVRLGLLNSGGAQDLVVFILARGRYEAANYANVFVPTNLDVTDATKSSFHGFYGRLFDATLQKAGARAVVTEYAWAPSTCDPCPGPTLDSVDMATLGSDLLYPSGVPGSGGFGSALPLQGTTAAVVEKKIEVEGKLPPAVVRRILLANRPRFRACYEKALKVSPTLAGTIATRFTIDPTGSVTKVVGAASTLNDAAMRECILGVHRTLAFPEPDGGSVSVTSELEYTPPPAKSDAGPPAYVDPGPDQPMTLTRLHTRYDARTLGDDLVFRRAQPVVGGREFRSDDGKLEQSAVGAGINNFQARYAIRHAWTGPVTCAKPIRGIWGAEPGKPGVGNWGMSQGPKPSVATKLAAAPRADVKLASLVTGGLDEPATWDEAATAFAAGKNAPPPLPPSPTASAAPVDAAPARRACHCELPKAASNDGALPLLVAFGLALGRRRR